MSTLVARCIKSLNPVAAFPPRVGEKVAQLGINFLGCIFYPSVDYCIAEIFHNGGIPIESRVRRYLAMLNFPTLCTNVHLKSRVKHGFLYSGLQHHSQIHTDRTMNNRKLSPYIHSMFSHDMWYSQKGIGLLFQRRCKSLESLIQDSVVGLKVYHSAFVI